MESTPPTVPSPIPLYLCRYATPQKTSGLLLAVSRNWDNKSFYSVERLLRNIQMGYWHLAHFLNTFSLFLCSSPQGRSSSLRTNYQRLPKCFIRPISSKSLIKWDFKTNLNLEPVLYGTERIIDSFTIILE